MAIQIEITTGDKVVLNKDVPVKFMGDIITLGKGTVIIIDDIYRDGSFIRLYGTPEDDNYTWEFMASDVNLIFPETC